MFHSLLVFAFVCIISAGSKETQSNQYRPRTVDQAVVIIKSEWLSKEDSDWILRNPEHQVSANLHFGLGTRIRNEFGLLDDNVELRNACGYGHADDCSGIIIAGLWESIRMDNDPEFVSELDRQFQLMETIMIDCTGFRDLRTGEWLSSLTSQIQAHMDKYNQQASDSVSFSIRVLGDPDMNGYTRAEFPEDDKCSQSFSRFLDWFSWRNAVTVRHNPPVIEFIFTEKCAWPVKDQGPVIKR